MALDLSLADLGDQPRLSEGAHSRRARFHQSWYRAARLGVKTWGQTPSGRPIGSILPPTAAEAGLNFVTPAARDLFRARRKQGWGVDPVRMTNHMTSSQTLLVNLLGPLGSCSSWLRNVLQLVVERLDIAEVIRWDIEFAPPARSRYLGDMTRLDAFFRVRTSRGIEGIVLELKYTDRFSSRRLDLVGNNRYAELQSSCGLWADHLDAFEDQESGQLLRCHALGTRVLQVDERTSNPATLLLISHPDDVAAPVVLERYRNHLVDSTQAVHVGLDRVLGAALSSAPTAAAADLVRELQLRYLGHSESQPLWLEHLAAASSTRALRRLSAEHCLDEGAAV
jgi:hypothetical protein